MFEFAGRIAVAELTLESLAKRVEELEVKLARLEPDSKPSERAKVTPGTGDWAGAWEAAGRLNASNFNFNVLKEMDEIERRFDEQKLQ